MKRRYKKGITIFLVIVVIIAVYFIYVFYLIQVRPRIRLLTNDTATQQVIERGNMVNHIERVIKEIRVTSHFDYIASNTENHGVIITYRCESCTDVGTTYHNVNGREIASCGGLGRNFSICDYIYQNIKTKDVIYISEGSF